MGTWIPAASMVATTGGVSAIPQPVQHFFEGRLEGDPGAVLRAAYAAPPARRPPAGDHRRQGVDPRQHLVGQLVARRVVEVAQDGCAGGPRDRTAEQVHGVERSAVPRPVTPWSTDVRRSARSHSAAKTARPRSTCPAVSGVKTWCPVRVSAVLADRSVLRVTLVGKSKVAASISTRLDVLGRGGQPRARAGRGRSSPADRGARKDSAEAASGRLGALDVGDGARGPAASPVDQRPGPLGRHA